MSASSTGEQLIVGAVLGLVSLIVVLGVVECCKPLFRSVFRDEDWE